MLDKTLFPQDAEKEQRLAPRRELHSPAIVYAAGEKAGWTVNVSSAGLLLEVPVPHDALLIGQAIAVDISVPNTEPEPLWVRAHGKVVRVHQKTMPRQYGIAVHDWAQAQHTG